MSIILHIIPLAQWEAARSIGLHAPETLQTEGFIHFSTPQQVLGVANKVFPGQTGLVLLVVDTDRLTSRLKWEAPVHLVNVEMPPTDDRFPHLYGPLNLDAVVRVVDFPPRENGLFDLPEGIL